MQCPFCKEVIQDGAIKCKHCGSMLDQGQVNGSTAKTAIPVNTQTDFYLLPSERLLEEGIVTNLL